MSFDINRVRVHVETKNGTSIPAVWHYYNKDGDTVTTSGYYADPRTKVGDHVIVQGSAASGKPVEYYVSAEKTLTACS